MSVIASSMFQGDRLQTVFTVRQIANAWDCSTRTIHRMINRGELKALRIGRSFRIVADDLKNWANAQAERTVKRIEDTRHLLSQKDQKRVDVVGAKIAELEKTPTVEVGQSVGNSGGAEN